MAYPEELRRHVYKTALKIIAILKEN